MESLAKDKNSGLRQQREKPKKLDQHFLKTESKKLWTKDFLLNSGKFLESKPSKNKFKHVGT